MGREERREVSGSGSVAMKAGMDKWWWWVKVGKRGGEVGRPSLGTLALWPLLAAAARGVAAQWVVADKEMSWTSFQILLGEARGKEVEEGTRWVFSYSLEEAHQRREEGGGGGGSPKGSHSPASFLFVVHGWDELPSHVHWRERIR